MSDMQDLSPYKIEIVEGINDDPTPANFENNGRGPNGAYFTQKHNDLIDALAVLDPGISGFTVSSFVEPYVFEVGTPMFLLPSNLVFTWDSRESARIDSLEIRLNGVRFNQANLNPQLETYTYAVNNVMLPPVYYSTEQENLWSINGVSNRGYEFQQTLAMRWKYRTIVGTSPSTDLASYLDASFTQLNQQSVLERPAMATKPSTDSAEYLYVFLPAAYDHYTTWSINGLTEFDLVESSAEISRFGTIISYQVYRSITATHGSFTILFN